MPVFALRTMPTWGIIDDEKAYDIGDKLRARYPSLKALIAAQAYSEAQAAKSAATPYPIAADRLATGDPQS